MPSFASLLAFAAPLMVLGAPLKRDTATNLLVLKFADVLEQFESQFYSQALQKFQASDFTNAGFVSAQLPIEQFTAIQSDEASHQSTLESVIQSLGSTPISNCSINFGNALNDVPTMAATARVVENLGVAAYLGAAHLIDDPVLLTAAGSILTVEARHQTILNVLNNGASIPQAYDLALLPNEVLAIASSFISNCDLGITANQPLTITNTGSVQPGTSLTFSSPALNGSTDGLFCQMLVAGMPTSLSLPFNQCVVPDGLDGPVGVFITSDNQPLNNDVVQRVNQAVVAGPVMAFIDTDQQLLSQLVLAAGSSDNSANSGNGASTTTISPSDATSIIASASSAGASIETGAVSATATATDSSAASATATDSSAASATDSSAASATDSSAASATDSSAASATSAGSGAIAAGPVSSIATSDVTLATPSAAASATGSAASASASASATGAVQAAAASPSGAVTESDKTVVASPGTANLATGTFGAITIDGWQSQ